MSMQTKLNWVQILITAIVTLGVTIGSGLVLSYVQTSKPRLVYTTTETIPFSGQEQVMGIYHVSISNEGRKATKDVICFVSARPAIIDQWDISADPALQYIESSTNNSLTLTLPILNPKELLQISILAMHPNSIPMVPEISLRAEGIMGIEKTQDRTQILGLYFPYIIALIGAFAGLTSLLLFRSLRENIEEEEEDRHPTIGEQNKILAFLFGNYSMLNEMKDYLKTTANITYWSEADKLGILALSSSEDYRNKIKAILQDLLEYTIIHKRSQGIIYYNIARIEAIQNNEEEMLKNLRKAKKFIPKLLYTRLKIDPIFKDMTLKQLQLEE